jgi:hypothetical protein
MSGQATSETDARVPLSGLKVIGDAFAPLLDAPLLGSAQAAEVMLITLVEAVPLPLAGQMLGNKARSELYEDQKAGRLEFVKDGRRTLCTTKSIFAYRKTWFKPYAASKAVAPPGPKARRRNSSKEYVPGAADG